MGIVIKHSSWNLVITGFGFLLGAINVLALATTYLDADYYGLMNYILSTAFLLFPLMSFGLHNTIVKYYSTYKTDRERNNFLTQMLFWPVIGAIPIFLLLFVFYDDIRLLISTTNQLTGDFLWPILLIAVFQAYFEIFYAWTKVYLKTIGGNFLKEVFYRAAATIALLLVAFEVITQVQFIYSLILIYFLRMLAMGIMAWRTYAPKFTFYKLEASREILWYSVLMVIAGSVGTALIDLDKNMLNQYVDLADISYYGVAGFIATVVAIPARGMAQIMHPLTAGYFNAGDLKKVEWLYKRSALNLTIVAGLLMVLIICNVQEFYGFLPPEFAIAIPVVLLICFVKFTENLLGSNNAILYNTNLYQFTLWLGLGLAIVAFLLNIWLIPIFGMIGAAIATCVAYVVYAFAKAYYVNIKLQMHPWTAKTTVALVVIIVVITIFYPWDFQWNLFVNIAVKSILIFILYAVLVYFLKLSTEVNSAIDQFFAKIKRPQ
ncbi:Membrane protein involved in the export of O-antigen and teichoic acid [Nonlabens sp. Hel1_33_55]|uniref:lipopolysaccharide biosynthesis protein n=1 Tax=Nonlabens sp. Hel1_33_55 TaxID=1336802 RepID=UPI000875BF5C|nr:polysaccharide biosynthesis C-terminal domain-containing protein [Nonlabens sp. Hel1_33_55]SCY01566.1 Membrane protein involved in the export of O-antigen and teichoic acid [Nonlabens sp. Hel1_33_55]